MHISEDEKRVLELMHKNNFQGISKENVLHLVSVLDKVDPDVAKVLIAQIPELAKVVVESEKEYAGVLSNGMASCDSSISSCFHTEDEIVAALQREIVKDDTSFGEKKYYFDKMVEAAERKEHKDTEHNNMILTILKYGGEAVVFGLLITAGVFLGRAGVKIPMIKRA